MSNPVSPTLPRKTYLDGWRGISIVAVFVGHFVGLQIANWGSLGVELFFALSGRLMAEILFVQKMPARPFLIRRFNRVWPVLLVFIVTLLVVSRLTTRLGPPLDFTTATGALTFTLGYLRLAGFGWHASEHIWSLCVEEHGYAILLVVATLGARKFLRAPLALTVLALGCIVNGVIRVVVFGQSYYDVYWYSDAKLHSLFLPVLAFMYRDRIAIALRPVASWISLACIVVTVGLFNHRVPVAMTGTLAPCFLSVAIVMLPHAAHWILRVLENKLLTKVGLCSYSLYIWQQPFMVLGENQAPAVRAAMALCAIAVGVSSYYLLEQPTRRWLNRHLTERNGEEGARTAA
jgi:peptidoglycan/LPS O-acetylase OafA/YrhL